MISTITPQSSPSLTARSRLYSYRAYGLNIHSELLLPELAIGQGNADVVIRIGKVEGLPTRARDEHRYLQATSEGIYLAWSGVGAFLVRDGREIIVEPLLNVEEHVLRLFILGTVWAMLLHQRGQVVVLHASVVANSSQAIAFIGPKGAGKSTMAATLHAQGYELIADDILAVEMSQRVPMALPGFPHFKLWPDSITSLGYVPETLPRLRPELEKRGHRITTRFAQGSVPLKCIYVLSQGPQPEIEALHPSQALRELMFHWYGARFGVDLLQALGLSTHFLQCAHLAKKVSVCVLRRPASLASLPDVAHIVKEHVMGDI